MENNFKYSFNEKRYHSYNYYLKNKYHTKVARVIIDAGFTCPNRDGKKGYGGCVYCSLKGSGDSNLDTSLSVLRQYENNKKLVLNKWQTSKFIPYFQSYSNTYGSLSKIQAMISPFLEMEEVVEIAIATRCDCLTKEIVEYLKCCANKKEICLEIGLQTSNKKSSEYLNLGYNIDDFKKMFNLLKDSYIKVSVHIINGLPYENQDDMIQTIKDIAHLPFHALKIHSLFITKDTKLKLLFEKENFPLQTRQEYIETVVKQLELIRPEVVIERLTGDPIKNDLIAPDWVLNKTTILNDIDKLMRLYNTYQGRLYNAL